MDDKTPVPIKRQRRKNPHNEKQLDYVRQRRTTEGGKGWRKVVSRVPRRERRLYRQTQERALRQSMTLDEEPGSTAGSEVRGMKRSRFRLLNHRREIPLGKRVS